MPAHTEAECLSLGDIEGSLQDRKDGRAKFSVFPPRVSYQRLELLCRGRCGCTAKKLAESGKWGHSCTYQGIWPGCLCVFQTRSPPQSKGLVSLLKQAVLSVWNTLPCAAMERSAEDLSAVLGRPATM